MTANGPNITDIKLLFAHSSNRCAFPKCKAPMAFGDTLLGEICHIKGARPGSARYDASQSPLERHQRENLILMCPTHHTVIDDDEASYTVERLQQIKREHETEATRLPDDEISRVAMSFEQNVSNKNQSGGISAHTVNASSITLQTTESNNRLIDQRRMVAVENLWSILRNLSTEFGFVIFVDTIFLPQEMEDFFNGRRDISLMDCVSEYQNPQCAISKLAKAGGDNAAKERLFVSQRLWSVYFVIHAIYGRTAYLLTNSFKDRTYVNWRNDHGCDQLLRTILPAQTVDSLKTRQSNGLRTAIDFLEDQFLVEAGMRK